MDLAKVLDQLHEELENVNAAIMSLERLQIGGRRRGRPPVWLAEATKPARRGGRKGGHLSRSPVSNRKNN